jgi:methionyl-tRNA formyltransferase
MSIIFIGTPAFAVPSLLALKGAGHDIIAVITQPDRRAGRGRYPSAPPVKVTAEDLGLDVLQPPTLRDPDIVAKIRDLEPEVIVVVAYGQILREDLLAIPARGVLNVHPSLLPRWRGASPIPAAILTGDQETGVTVILMDRGMDSGPILAQTSVLIAPTDSTASLMDTLSAIAADLLASMLPRWLNGQIQPKAQDETKVTICSTLRREDAQIDWTLPAEAICRRIRAYNPWPGGYTYLDGQLLHIWEAWPAGDERGKPGRIVPVDRGVAHRIVADPNAAAFAIETGAGLLFPLKLQRSGRRTMSAGEFLRGMPRFVGQRLGRRDVDS